MLIIFNSSYIDSVST